MLAFSGFSIWSKYIPSKYALRCRIFLCILYLETKTYKDKEKEMQSEKRIHKQNPYTNELFYRITTFYVCVMLLMGSISMSLAFVKECGEILNKQKLVMTELEYVYRDRTDEFWRLYMPIFQYEDTIYSGLYEYLNGEKSTPYQKKELLDALQNIIAYDPKLKWIGIHSETNKQN